MGFKKMEFIKTLSKVAPEGSELKVGDLVEWINDYGTKFQHIILGFDYEGSYNKKYNKFVIVDKDSYWFPLDHKKIKKIMKEGKK